MTILELKQSIHDKIDHLNDPDYLEMLNAMLANHGMKIKIPEEHLASINKGSKAIENGDFLTLEAFEKRYENDKKTSHNA